MQRDAVHRRRHPELAHAVVDIAAGEIQRCQGRHAGGFGIVRAGEVGRAADEVGLASSPAPRAPSAPSRRVACAASARLAVRLNSAIASEAAGLMFRPSRSRTRRVADASPRWRAFQARRAASPRAAGLAPGGETVVCGISKGGAVQPSFSRPPATSGAPSAAPCASASRPCSARRSRSASCRRSGWAVGILRLSSAPRRSPADHDRRRASASQPAALKRATWSPSLGQARSRRRW